MGRGFIGGICLFLCLFLASAEDFSPSKDLETERTSGTDDSSGALFEGSANVASDVLSFFNQGASGEEKDTFESSASLLSRLNSDDVAEVDNANPQALASRSSNIDRMLYPLAPGGVLGTSTRARAEAPTKVKTNLNDRPKNDYYFGNGINPIDWFPSVLANQAKAGGSAKIKLPNTAELNIFQPDYLTPIQSRPWNQMHLAQGKNKENDNAVNHYPTQNAHDGLLYQPGYIQSGGLDNKWRITQAQADTQAISKETRLVPLNQYIYPALLKGYENVITCSRNAEIHYWQTNVMGCMICVCVEESGALSPVCATCSACSAVEPEPSPVLAPPSDIILIPPETTVSPTPPSSPSPPPERQVPEPEPKPQLSCSPLPSNQPYESPLNPCQICICTESNNSLQKPTVKIECHANPQCVIPSDVTTLPPLPDRPTPLPICEKFPKNVLFPHPNDACSLCKCTVGQSDSGRPEAQIACGPNPECSPVTHPPDVTSTTVPNISSVVPWTPPPTTPQPIPTTIKSPLPGPKPHESCEPYKAEVPFQHPWDECQMCVCSMAAAVGLVTIEINCYTKKSCCYEPPEMIETTNVPQISNLQILDPICEKKTFGVEFEHPQDECRICFCNLKDNVVKPVCFKSNNPNCSSAVNPSESGPHNAQVKIIGNGKTSSLGLIPQSQRITGYRPRPSITGNQQASVIVEGTNQENLGDNKYFISLGKPYLNKGNYISKYNNIDDINYPSSYDLSGYKGFLDRDNIGIIDGKPGTWVGNQVYYRPGQQNEEALGNAPLGPQHGEYKLVYPNHNRFEEYNFINKDKVNSLGSVESLAEKEALNTWLLNLMKVHPEYKGYYSGANFDGQHFVEDHNLADDKYKKQALAQALAKAIENDKLTDYPSVYSSADRISDLGLYRDSYNRPSSQIVPHYFTEKSGYESALPLLRSLDDDGSEDLAMVKSKAESQQETKEKSQVQRQSQVDKSGDPLVEGEKDVN